MITLYPLKKEINGSRGMNTSLWGRNIHSSGIELSREKKLSHCGSFFCAQIFPMRKKLKNCISEDSKLQQKNISWRCMKNFIWICKMKMPTLWQSHLYLTTLCQLNLHDSALCYVVHKIIWENSGKRGQILLCIMLFLHNCAMFTYIDNYWHNFLDFFISLLTIR